MYADYSTTFKQIPIVVDNAATDAVVVPSSGWLREVLTFMKQRY
jgi:hypothetical protein